MSQLSLVQEEVSRLKSELATEQARCTKLRAEVSSTSVGHVKVRSAQLVVHARAVPLCWSSCPTWMVCRAYRGSPCPLGLHGAPTASHSLACTACRRGQSLLQELENKARMMEDVVAAMQAEERAKLDAQHEARVYRARLAELEVRQLLEPAVPDRLASW